MKNTLVQRISKSINSYKSVFYDINLAINVVSWFRKLYPSVLFRYLVEVKNFSKILPKTTFQFTYKSDFSFTTNLTFRLPTSLDFAQRTHVSPAKPTP